MDGNIVAKGIRVNNLKGIDVTIPRGKFVVITGLSGSGKSSLAFDTLFADGQRRYVESLSSYARQFMGRLQKPECDYIHGIPPAIAIEQRTTNRSQRSTVGTSTEIYDYLRMLFARAGKTISPISGQEVKSDTIEDVVNYVLQMNEGQRFTVESPLTVPQGRTMRQQLEMELKQGFSRVSISGDIHDIADLLGSMTDKQLEGLEVNILIDRLARRSDADSLSRLRESIETAFDEGNQRCIIRIKEEVKKEEAPAAELSNSQTPELSNSRTFSIAFERDGIQFERPTDAMFSFNSPAGACPECEGFGSLIGIDESLVIPNSSLSVYDGAVQCWRGEKMSEWVSEKKRQSIGKSEMYRDFESDVLEKIERIVKKHLTLKDVDYTEKDLSALLGYALSAEEIGIDGELEHRPLVAETLTVVKDGQTEVLIHTGECLLQLFYVDDIAVGDKHGMYLHGQLHIFINQLVQRLGCLIELPHRAVTILAHPLQKWGGSIVEVGFHHRIAELKVGFFLRACHRNVNQHNDQFLLLGIDVDFAVLQGGTQVFRA